MVNFKKPNSSKIFLYFLLLSLAFYYIVTIRDVAEYKALDFYKSKLNVTQRVLEIRKNLTLSCMSDYKGLDEWYSKPELEHFLKMCFVRRAGYYVKREVKYKPDRDKIFEDLLLYNKTPDEVLENGSDCQGYFILWAEIVNVDGVSCYVVSQSRHICGLAIVDETTPVWFNCNMSLPIVAIKKLY